MEWQPIETAPRRGSVLRGMFPSLRPEMPKAQGLIRFYEPTAKWQHVDLFDGEWTDCAQAYQPEKWRWPDQ